MLETHIIENYTLITCAMMEELLQVAEILNLEIAPKENNKRVYFTEGGKPIVESSGGIVATLTGIGLVNSAISLANTVAELGRPKRVLNIGTAGSLSAGRMNYYKIGDVVQVGKCINYHMFINEDLKDGTEIVETNSPEDSVCATVTEFLKDGSSIPSQIDIVDMELFPQVRYCALAGIPIKSIKVISDYCNPDTSKEFTENVEKIILQSKDTVLQEIGRFV